MLQGKEILPLVPGFQLDEITTRLFGEDAVEYDIGTEAADAACLAIELHDFADAVLTGRAPEVDGRGGMTAVAGILGAYESGLAGRPVTMDELLGQGVRLPGPDRRGAGAVGGSGAMTLDIKDLGRVRQIALVVEDLEESIHAYADLLGVGPWSAYELSSGLPAGHDLRGQPGRVLLPARSAWSGETQLELVQPLRRAEHLRRSPQRARAGAPPRRHRRGRSRGLGPALQGCRPSSAAERSRLRCRRHRSILPTSTSVIRSPASWS